MQHGYVASRFGCPTGVLKSGENRQYRIEMLTCQVEYDDALVLTWSKTLCIIEVVVMRDEDACSKAQHILIMRSRGSEGHLVAAMLL